MLWKYKIRGISVKYDRHPLMEGNCFKIHWEERGNIQFFFCLYFVVSKNIKVFD